MRHGDSLKFVGTQAELQTDDRDDFVLLLTDDSAELQPEQSQRRTASCNCTQSQWRTSPLGCLDKDGSKAQVAALRAKEIRTVISFGAEDVGGRRSGHAERHGGEGELLARTCDESLSMPAARATQCDTRRRSCAAGASTRPPTGPARRSASGCHQPAWPGSLPARPEALQLPSDEFVIVYVNDVSDC